MEYILLSFIIGLLFAKAADNMQPGRGLPVLMTMVILWPAYLLILAFWGKSNEEENP